MGSVRTWARGFARWIKSLLGSVEHRPTIVADTYNANTALYRIEDPDIPGCVELWKIVRRQSSGDLILVLLDRAQLRQELGIRCSLARTHSEPWQTQLSRRLATELKTQADVDGSHLVVVCWMRDRALVDPKGRRYRVPTANLIGAWICEFQGEAGAIRGNRYASQIVKVIAYKIFNTQLELLTWEEFIDSIPWLEWLDLFAKHYIWRDHVLQPPKRKPVNPAPARHS